MIIADPGAVTSPSYTKIGDTVTITATPPSNRGTKNTGTDTAAIQAKAESGVNADIAGKRAITGNTQLKAGFEVTGIAKDTQYRYFIRTIHPVNTALYSDTSETLSFVLDSSGKVAVIAAISALHCLMGIRNVPP